MKLILFERALKKMSNKKKISEIGQAVKEWQAF